MGAEYDILIIGGGVNGAAIARDAAGRGFKTLLCEMNDLASATSSASTKLIHGGLRYLEYYEFRLVREALKEREILLRAAPHIVRPLRFVLPHHGGLRPRWLLRAGLFLYDHLGGREMLRGADSISFAGDPRGRPLKPEYRVGFEYSDCWVDDARLVVLLVLDAKARGATILTRTKAKSVSAQDGVFFAELEDKSGVKSVTARALVNAAGPWVDAVLGEIVRPAAAKKHKLRLVKGSHIIVDKLYDGEHAYIFQNADRRVIFAIPYEGRFTLIGTTDAPYDGDPAAVAAGPDEVAYLCAAASDYFAKPVSVEIVRRTYSGVRPLHDEGGLENASAVTRDYALDLAGGPPVLSVYGGKITTHRRLAEHAMEKLEAHLGARGRPWTAAAPLPGGDIPDADFEQFFAALSASAPFVPPSTLRRLARNYGAYVERLLGGATRFEDLGEDFGGGLTRREVDYLLAEEFAQTTEDILWRRSKLGLHVGADAVSRLDRYLAMQAP